MHVTAQCNIGDVKFNPDWLLPCGSLGVLARDARRCRVRRASARKVSVFDG